MSATAAATGIAVPAITTDMSQLDAALAHASLGIYVFPADHPELSICAGIGKDHDPFSPNHQRGKHPCVVWGKKATIKEQVIRAHWSRYPRNIGIHCGKSGLFVVDEDAPDEFARYAADHNVEIPETYAVSTAKGMHYYFADTEAGALGNREGAFEHYAINIRSGNGYVIAPSSVHEAGVVYTANGVSTIAPLPTWIPDAIRGRKQTSNHPPSAEEVLFGGREGFKLPEIIKEHHRDTTLYRFACSLRAQGINRKTAELVMETAWARCEQPPTVKTPYTLDEALAKVENAYSQHEEGRSEGYEPRGGGAGESSGEANFHQPISLDQARATFKRWLGDDYDTDALDAMLATAAVERLDGDPVWLLIISGSGNAKTETVQALSGIGATVVSTITSEGALLSATSKRERTSEATGGLLREIGDRGVLVIKDVTSILSMNRDLRGQVLGALREIHDGSWVRKAGTDGGRSLPWKGRIAIIGAVTTKWDQAHDVIASMGDRFVLVRIDSTTGRVAAGRKAISNTGVESQMRTELAEAVAGVLAGMETTGITLSEEETDIVLAAADLVTLARTGVEYDYRGDVIDAHAPEMPTRFAKELTQIIRGSVAIGIDRYQALRLAIRCARDSMPPLRLAIIDDLASNPGSTLAEVRPRLNKPRSTIDRQLQALHILGVLSVEAVEEPPATGGKVTTRWYYRLAEGIEPDALNPDRLPEMSVGAPRPSEERDRDSDEHSMDGDISGERAPACRLDGCGTALYNPQSAALGLCVVHQDKGAAA